MLITTQNSVTAYAAHTKTAVETPSAVQEPSHYDSFQPSRSRGNDFAGLTRIMVTKLGPAAAATGALATYAHSVGGPWAAGAAVIGVPIVAAGVSAVAESLNFGGGPNFGGAKGLNTMLVGGSGLVGGAVGAMVGAHYGSAILGGVVGGLAPAALAVATLGTVALLSKF